LRSKKDELTLAREIKTKVDQLGFETYVALDVQNLEGLKESVFTQLTNSEYFIFIDFKREKMADDPLDHRGSLFSHQELALATYLEIQVMAFQEDGVKKGDGIIHFLQTNPYPFSDRRKLPDLVAGELRNRVRDRRWDPHWRSELIIEHASKPFTNSFHRGHQKLTRYFFIGVRNRHRHKVARNCYAYLNKIIRVDTGEEIHPKAIELKWTGYTFPNAHIPPHTVRDLDAFYLIHDLPDKFQYFNYIHGCDRLYS
jgi:hypothetical protein